MNSQAVPDDDGDGDNDQLAAELSQPSSLSRQSVPSSVKSKKYLSFAYFDSPEGMQAASKADWWKVQLGKYIK
jgi:hypothetical protein